MQPLQKDTFFHSRIIRNGKKRPQKSAAEGSVRTPWIINRTTIALALFYMAACMGFPGAGAAYAQPGQVQEYKLKSVLLYHFLRFSQWPPDTTPRVTMDLCVLGDDPFGSILQPLSHKDIKGIPLFLRYLPSGDMENARKCEVLFISQSEEAELAKILADLEGYPVLIVSDIPNFIARGGAIFLSLSGTKVGFDVILSRVHEHGVMMSAKLLELANSVTP